MNFAEGNARQDNSVVPQGPAIVVSRLLTRLKEKKAPGGKVESIVHGDYY